MSGPGVRSFVRSFSPGSPSFGGGAKKVGRTRKRLPLPSIIGHPDPDPEDDQTTILRWIEPEDEMRENRGIEQGVALSRRARFVRLCVGVIRSLRWRNLGYLAFC